MTQKNTKTFMHTLSRFAGGVVSLFSGVKAEVKRDVKERVDMAVDRLDLVKRDEFDRLKATVQKSAPVKKATKKAKAAKPAAKKAAPAKASKAAPKAVKKPAAKQATAKKPAAKKPTSKSPTKKA